MIDAPGIYSLSMAEYLSDPVCVPSLTASVANLLLTRSPAHARMAHPRLYAGFEREDDSRFELGSAAHALLLEQDGSAIEFIAASDWRTNKAKEERDAARAAGKLPVLTKYDGVLTEMVRVARQAIADSELAGIFDRGKPELTYVWQEDNGAWCRCRPDWYTDKRDIVLDFKTSESAEPEFFIRQIARLGYDVSAAFYLRGLDAFGTKNYCWLVQEVEPPFCCSLVTLGNGYRALADEKVSRAIDLWQKCLAADRWPAYDLRLHYAEPNSWMLAEYEARMNRSA